MPSTTLNGFLKLDAQGTTNIRLAAIAMKALPDSETQTISEWVNAELGDQMQPLISERIKTPLDERIYAGNSTIRASGTSISIKQPVATGRLSGGFKLAAGNGGRSNTPGYIAVEFGADRDKVVEVTRRTKRGLVEYARHTARQLPPRYRKGRVFYPSVQKMMPRILSMVAQTSIRAYLDCFGDK